jgi:tetratricopeptide (TPR) repeat protein
MHRIGIFMAVAVLVSCQAFAAAPPGTSAITALRQSSALINMEHYDAALNTVNNALKSDPGYLPLWRERGKILLLQKKYPEALMVLKAVRAVSPRDPDANLLLFQVLAAAPDPVVAAAGLSLPAFLDGLDTEGIGAILTYLLENSRQTQLMRTLIEHWSPKAAQQQALAAILKRYADGDLADAEKDLVSDKTLAATYGKTLARFVYLIGVAYRDAGRYDDALRAFREAATMGHDPTEIQGEIGWVYVRMGDPAKAMAIWEAHWREASNPGDWTLWIGKTAMDAGDYAKAETFYLHALGFQPKDPLLRGRYLCALLLAKQDDKAAAYRQKLESEEAGDSVAFGQALLAMKEKRPDAALEALSRIGNPHPFREEITAMAREIASIPGPRETVEKRARAIAALLRDSPAEASILRDLAWTLWNAGSVDAALQLWDASLNLGLPQSDSLKRQVVLRLLEAGKTQAARTFMQRHMPQVSPLGLAVSLARQGKPDIAVQLVATDPAGQDPDWTALVDAACLLRTGDSAKALEQLAHLARRTSPLPTLRLMSFDAQGALLPQPLTQQEALAFYRQIARDMIDQDLEKGFVFLAKPAWLPALTPRDSAALSAQAGAVAMRAGREAQGSALCRAALALDPGNALAAAYLLMGEGAGEPASAQDQRVRHILAQVAPFDREYISGVLLQREGKSRQALEHLLRALVLAPTEQGLRLQVIDLLVGENWFDAARRAQRWFEERLAQGDKTVRAATANTRTSLGEPDKAIPLWQELLREYPGDLRYLAGLGRSLNMARRYGETRQILGKALRENPSPALARIVAEADAALGTSADALRAAELGLKKDPKDLQLLRAAAESAESTARPEEAVAYSRRALAVNPQSIPLHETLGRGLIERRDFEEAKAFFQSMVQGNDAQDAALRGLLTVAQETDDVKGGYRTALALHEARPADPGIALKYAIAAAGDKRFATAYRVLRPMAAPSRGDGVLALYYPEILDTTAAGKVRLPLWLDHMQLLRERGTTFVSLGDFREEPGKTALTLPSCSVAAGPCVMLLVGKAEASVLKRLDESLKAANGRAMLVVDGASLAEGTPYSIDRAGIKALLATGRWSLVLTDADAPAIPLADGERGRFWGQAKWLGQAVETDAQMRERLEQRLRRLRTEAGDLPIAAWLYPGGLAPDDLINVTPGQRQAYRDAVAAFFPVAFTTSPEGFVTTDNDKGLLPVRAVAAGWDASLLDVHLKERVPRHQAVFELGKTTSWHEQLDRADMLYERARKLGVNPGELAYHRSANALAEGDTPRALAFAREALVTDPTSEKYQRQLERVERTTHPKLAPVYDLYWDSDNRTNSWLGMTGSVVPRDDLELSAGLGALSWTRDGQQSRRYFKRKLFGQEISAGAKYFTWPDGWLEGKLAMTTLDSGDDPFLGGSLALHGGLSTEVLRLNGTYDLRYSHERVDTIEAMEAGIRSHHVTLESHFRVLDFWEIWANENVESYSDGNRSFMLDGRIMRRLTEAPQFSLGYAYQFGSSDRNPEEYWAPLDLATHLAYATLTYAFTDRIRLNGYAGCGPSIARGTDWRFVTRTGARLTLVLTDSLRLDAQYAYYKTPNYSLNHINLGVAYTF